MPEPSVIRVLVDKEVCMNEPVTAWSLARKLSWEDALRVAGVLVSAWLVAAMLRWAIRHLAKKTPARLRLLMLRFLPLAHFVIGIGAVVVIVPILVEPKFQNVIALVTSAGVALAFAFKDYAQPSGRRSDHRIGEHLSLLCVADFYLHPEHDAALVRRRLSDVAQAGSYRKPETAITVLVFERLGGRIIG